MESICNADGVLPVDTLDGLASLIDRACCNRRSAAMASHTLSLYTFIREYALERLIESGEAEAIRQQQAAFFFHGRKLRNST